MYTRKEHLEMAACLRKAKTHLAANVADYNAGKAAMVCWAISYTRSSCAPLLNRWINTQLDGHPVLGYWLACTHPELGTDALLETNKNLWRNKIQATRHAWVDHMIAVLEAP